LTILHYRYTDYSLLQAAPATARTPRSNVGYRTYRIKGQLTRAFNNNGNRISRPTSKTKITAIVCSPLVR